MIKKYSGQGVAGLRKKYMYDFIINFIDVISAPLKYISRVKDYISTPKFSIAFKDSFLSVFVWFAILFYYVI